MERRILTNGRFATTQWNVVRAASSTPDTLRIEALDYLLRCYCPALIEYLKRQFRFTEEAASDLVQSFVADRVLTKNLLSKASEKRGKFRTFLLSSIRSYTYDHLRHGQRQKRAPTEGFQSIESISESLPDPDSEQHQEVFDDGFARQVIAEAIHRTHQQCLTDDSPEVWEILYARVLGHYFEGVPKESYADLVQDLGLSEAKEAHRMLETGKRTFKRHFKAVIEEFASDKKEFDEELAYLKKFFER